LNSAMAAPSSRSLVCKRFASRVERRSATATSVSFKLTQLNEYASSVSVEQADLAQRAVAIQISAEPMSRNYRIVGPAKYNPACDDPVQPLGGRTWATVASVPATQSVS